MTEFILPFNVRSSLIKYVIAQIYAKFKSGQPSFIRIIEYKPSDIFKIKKREDGQAVLTRCQMYLEDIR